MCMMDDCPHLIRLTYSQNLLKAVNPRSLAPIYVHANPALLRCRGPHNGGIAVVVFFPKGSEALGEVTKYPFIPQSNPSVSLLAGPWLTHYCSLPNNSFRTSENVAVMFKSTKMIAAVMNTRLQSTPVEDQEGG